LVHQVHWIASSYGPCDHGLRNALLSTFLGPVQYEEDEISVVLGDTRRAESYRLVELTRQLYPHQRGKVVEVSRYYLLRRPPVIVDFEPPPSRGPMHCEQKRRWCQGQGIIYVPIFLADRLTREQFAERVRLEQDAMARSRRDQREHAALDAVSLNAYDPTEISEPDIDRLALELLEAETRRHGNLRGAARANRLAHLKRQLLLHRTS
jgi:hypothetical protein